MLLLTAQASLQLLGLELPPASPPVNLVQTASAMFSNVGAVKAGDAALGFSVLGCILAIRVII